MRARLAQGVADRINRADLRLYGKSFEIDRRVELRNRDQIVIGNGCLLKAGVILNGRSDDHEFGIDLGDDTYIKEGCILDAYGGRIRIAGACAFGQNTVMHGGGGISIGRYVIVGAQCYFIASNHAYRSPELPIMLQGDYRKGISIGNNVWIGGGVVILDGVTVGDNAVIGAGTLVSRDVPEGTLLFDKRSPRTERLFD
jgi:acetyltransferase-like isoleucine patch superfamily enzyme